MRSGRYGAAAATTKKRCWQAVMALRSIWRRRSGSALAAVALASALHAVVSLRLVPRVDRPGRVPAAEVLVNTPAVRDNIRDMTKSLNIPELIREGTVQYGMQSFDQSLMAWYTRGVISFESALFYATSPAEFALRAQGVAGSSDTSWDPFQRGTDA